MKFPPKGCKKPTPKPEKQPIDWEAIELDYRAGIKTLRAMASEHGCSHVAIKKKADKEGWVRDLSAKIAAAAAEKVNKAAVTKEVNVETRIAERETIEANAQMQADVILSHRQDIKRARNLAMRLLEELEGVTDNRDLFEQLGELLRSEDKNGQDRRNDLYHKILELPNRTGAIKQLSDTLKNLIGLERQAFNLKDENGDDPVGAAARGAVEGVMKALPALETVKAKFDAVLNGS